MLDYFSHIRYYPSPFKIWGDLYSRNYVLVTGNIYNKNLDQKDYIFVCISVQRRGLYKVPSEVSNLFETAKLLSQTT
jgi:hypothetical protein